jgi:hypothetical protein
MVIKQLFDNLRYSMVRWDADGNAVWAPFGIFQKRYFLLDSPTKLRLPQYSLGMLMLFTFILVAMTPKFGNDILFLLCFFLIIPFIFLLNKILIRHYKLIEVEVKFPLKEYNRPPEMMFKIMYTCYLILALLGVLILTYGDPLFGILCIATAVFASWSARKMQIRNR